MTDYRFFCFFLLFFKQRQVETSTIFINTLSAPPPLRTSLQLTAPYLPPPPHTHTHTPCPANVYSASHFYQRTRERRKAVEWERPDRLRERGRQTDRQTDKGTDGGMWRHKPSARVTHSLTFIGVWVRSSILP